MGIIFGLLAALSQAISYTLLKKSYEELPPSVAFLFDACFGLLIWVPFALIIGFNFAGSAATSKDAELLVKAEMAGIEIFQPVASFTKKVVKGKENHQQAWSDVMEEISGAYLDKTNLT